MDEELIRELVDQELKGGYLQETAKSGRYKS